MGWWRRRDEMQKVLILIVVVIGGWFLWQSDLLPGMGSDDNETAVTDGEESSDGEEVPTTELQPFQTYQDESEQVGYDDLRANAEEYRGRMITFTGQVLEFEMDLGLTVMKLAITQESDGYDPEEAVVVGYGGREEVAEGDVITVWGDGLGLLELSEGDQSRQLPSVLAKYIEKSGTS